MTNFTRNLRGRNYILTMIYQYLYETGNKSITYDGLTGFIARKHAKYYKLETIQKYMRNLARVGYFTRIYVPSYQHPSAKTVLYIPTDKFWEYFKKNVNKNVDQ